MAIPTELENQIAEHDFVCGSDECGLGAWCGPLSVCAVVVPRGWSYAGVTDSKKLSRKARERVYPELIKRVTFCLVHIEAPEFDALGASAAFIEAHTRAIKGALQQHSGSQPFVVIDGSRSVAGAYPLPKADLLVAAVSAASIIAKVNHDWRMDELDRQHPGYGLSKSVGYGTPAHLAALRRLGVTSAHRKTYAPMREMLLGAHA